MVPSTLGWSDGSLYHHRPDIRSYLEATWTLEVLYNDGSWSEVETVRPALHENEFDRYSQDDIRRIGVARSDALHRLWGEWRIRSFTIRLRRDGKIIKRVYNGDRLIA